MKRVYYILCIILLLAAYSCRESAEEHAHDHDQEQDGIHEHDDLSHESRSGELEEESSSTHIHGTSEYSLFTVVEEPFSFAIKTGGRIMVDSKDVMIITAKSSGLVSMISDYLFPGVKIGNGDIMFTISGSQLTEGNTELRFKQVKADLEQAKANFERAEKLISDKIITEENYLSVKNNYEKLQNEYDNLSATKGGNLVSSPGDGYIKDIFVVEGQKVEAGQELASIVAAHNLVLRADVSPDNLAFINDVEGANFRVGYRNDLYKLSELNGRKISYGKSTDQSSYYIPVYFRMDYIPELIDGTFAEVFLLGKEIKDAVAIPDSALLEEYGQTYVYIAESDGDFTRRNVVTAQGDGKRTLIISGLKAGERIVASGTYHIRLSQSSSTAPSHNHNH